MWWCFIAGAVIFSYSDFTFNSFSDVTFCSHYTVSSYPDVTFWSQYTVSSYSDVTVGSYSDVSSYSNDTNDSDTVSTPFYHAYTTSAICSAITTTAYF